MIARRAAYVDEYVEAGESAVLLEHRVLVLSPMATTILATIGEGEVDVATIAAVLEATFGAAPGGDSVAATRAALESLAEKGLVELG